MMFITAVGALSMAMFICWNFGDDVVDSIALQLVVAIMIVGGVVVLADPAIWPAGLRS